MENSGQCSSVAESLASLKMKLSAESSAPVERGEEASLFTHTGSLHASDFDLTSASSNSDHQETTKPGQDQSDDDSLDMKNFELKFRRAPPGLDMPSLDPLPLHPEVETRAALAEEKHVESMAVEPPTSGEERAANLGMFSIDADRRQPIKKKRLRTAKERALLQQRSKRAFAIQAACNRGQSLEEELKLDLDDEDSSEEPPRKIAKMNSGLQRVTTHSKAFCFEDMLWLWLRRSFLKFSMLFGPYSMIHTPCCDWILEIVRDTTNDGASMGSLMGTGGIRRQIVPFRHMCVSQERPSYTAPSMSVGCYPIPRSVIKQLFDGMLSLKRQSCIFKEIPWNVQQKIEEYTRPSGSAIGNHRECRSQVQKATTSRPKPKLARYVFESTNVYIPGSVVDVLAYRIPWAPSLESIEE